MGTINSFVYPSHLSHPSYFPIAPIPYLFNDDAVDIISSAVVIALLLIS